jgi:hypothetical protein
MSEEKKPSCYGDYDPGNAVCTVCEDNDECRCHSKTDCDMCDDEEERKGKSEEDEE